MCREIPGAKHEWRRIIRYTILRRTALGTRVLAAVTLLVGACASAGDFEYAGNIREHHESGLMRPITVH